MRNLILLLLLVVAGFFVTGLFVAPHQPAIRDWYLVSACPQLDKLSPQICEPIRKAQDGQTQDL